MKVVRVGLIAWPPFTAYYWRAAVEVMMTAFVIVLVVVFPDWSVDCVDAVLLAWPEICHGSRLVETQLPSLTVMSYKPSRIRMLITTTSSLFVCSRDSSFVISLLIYTCPRMQSSDASRSKCALPRMMVTFSSFLNVTHSSRGWPSTGT